jgi:hypothetical protein
MDKFIKVIVNSISGVMLPKEVKEDKLTKNIYEALDKFDYFTMDMDKKNIRNDISVINRDFNKFKKEAESKAEAMAL